MTTPESPMPHDDVGVGPVLVLLHAFPLDARMWAPQRDAFSSDYRVVTPDFAGFGRAHAATPRTSLDAHADDVAALLDALGITKATVLGLSMGGYVALAFARRHPDRLAGLILADTRASGDSAEAKEGRRRSIAQVDSDGVPALVETLLPKLLAANDESAVTEQVRRIASEQTSIAVTSALEAMRDRIDSTPVLAEIGVEALVLVGSEDVLTPPDESRRIADALPNGSYVELPNAGHLSNLESVYAFNAAVLDWLGQRARV